MLHFIRYQLPAVVWAGLIFAISSISFLPTPSLGFNFEDKISHAVEFGILGYLLVRAFYYQNHESIRNRAVLLAIIIGILYAISDEIHQTMVPGRNCDLADIIADTIGVLCAQVIFLNRRKIAHILVRKNTSFKEG